jgi:hypothetical protein
VDWRDAVRTLAERRGNLRIAELTREDNPHHEYWRARAMSMVDPAAFPEVSRRAKTALTSRTYPPLAQQATNFAGAMSRAFVAAVTGEQVLCTPEQRAEREAICEPCEKLVNGKCILCGCPYRKKLALATEDCPLGKWPKLEGASS